MATETARSTERCVQSLGRRGSACRLAVTLRAIGGGRENAVIRFCAGGPGAEGLMARVTLTHVHRATRVGIRIHVCVLRHKTAVVAAGALIVQSTVIHDTGRECRLAGMAAVTLFGCPH
jgi:hypothetical protein